MVDRPDEDRAGTRTNRQPAYLFETSTAGVGVDTDLRPLVHIFAYRHKPVSHSARPICGIPELPQISRPRRGYPEVVSGVLDMNRAQP